MAWLSSDDPFRWPFVVDRSSAGANDVTLTVPPCFDRFWEAVRSDGADVAVTTADGQTLVAGTLTSWNAATRTGVIDLDDVMWAKSATLVLWLYWGDSARTTSRLTSAHTPTSARTARLYLGGPPVVTIPARREAPGASVLTIEIGKRATGQDTMTIGVEITDWLTESAELVCGRRAWTEPDHLHADALTGGYQAGAAWAALAVNPAGAVLCRQGDRYWWVLTIGTSTDPAPQDGELRVTFSVADPVLGSRNITVAALIRIRDPQEA